jgi:carboxylesterase type B
MRNSIRTGEFTPMEKRATMVFDNECKTVDDPARADRIAVNPAPAYAAGLAGRR